MLRLAHRAPFIESLRIGLCRQLTDDSLQVLAACCRRLSHIELQNSSITTAGVRALAASCRSLKFVDLTACSLIDDGCMEPLSTLPLEYLSVAACKKLTVRLFCLGGGVAIVLVYFCPFLFSIFPLVLTDDERSCFADRTRRFLVCPRACAH